MREICLCNLLIAFFALCGCSDDKENFDPIKLQGEENPTVQIYYPTSQVYTYSLEGGDGNYTAFASYNDFVGEVEIVSGNQLQFKVSKPGRLIATVEDGSGNSLQVHFLVDYFALNMIVNDVEVSIRGELTEEEAEAIRKDATTLSLVHPDGGYGFYFRDELRTKGTVNVYPDNYAMPNNRQECDFRLLENTDLYIEGKNDAYYIFEITVDKEKETKRVLYLRPYTRLSVAPPMALYEDFTDYFKSTYPEVEEVEVLQRIQHANNN